MNLFVLFSLHTLGRTVFCPVEHCKNLAIMKYLLAVSSVLFWFKGCLNSNHSAPNIGKKVKHVQKGVGKFLIRVDVCKVPEKCIDRF